MAYKKTGSGNGRVYIGVVKWGHDNSDIMLFSSESVRNKFFEDNFDLIKTNNIFINENKFVDIKETIEDIANYNYLFYYNDSDITSKPRCCFINSYEYIAPNTTRIYIELDVIQQFIYQTDFYQSYVVRATVKKSVDTVGAYTQNEPFSVKLEYESLKSDILTVSDWAPTWVLHATSKYIPSDDTYHYEGTGTDNTFGEYGFYINTANHLKNYIERYGRKSLPDIFKDAGIEVDWKALLAAFVSGGTSPESMSAFSIDFGASVAELQDHRNELIGLYAIPTWARGSGSEATNNRTTIQSSAITLNNQTLANGYTPRNKKMLTSICRAYVLLNRTGLQIALKPELFTANSTYIGLGCIPMCTSGYQYFIANYANAAASYGEVPYTSERRVGFDQNTGLNKVLSYINAASNVAGAVGNAKLLKLFDKGRDKCAKECGILLAAGISFPAEYLFVAVFGMRHYLGRVLCSPLGEEVRDLKILDAKLKAKIYPSLKLLKAK